MAFPSSWRRSPAAPCCPTLHAGIPKGDRGGGDSRVRVAQDRAPLSLHRLWDGLITSSNNVRTLRNMANELRKRFPRTSMTELATDESEAWAKESFEIATKIAYQNGALRG